MTATIISAKLNYNQKRSDETQYKGYFSQMPNSI